MNSEVDGEYATETEMDECDELFQATSFARRQAQDVVFAVCDLLVAHNQAEMIRATYRKRLRSADDLDLQNSGTAMSARKGSYSHL